MSSDKDNELAWKTLSSEYLSQKPWFTARRDHVQLPNGQEIEDFYVLEYPNWVNTIAITKDKKFIMIRQYRYALGVTAFELCAGGCEDEDASPLISAQRELLEETGYGNGNWSQYMVVSANAGTNTNLTYTFLATDVEIVSEPHLEDTECLTVHLMTFDEVKNLLLHNEIKQALFAAPLWKYVAENGGV